MDRGAATSEYGGPVETARIRTLEADVICYDRTCLKTVRDCSITQTYIVCFFLQVIKHDLPDQQNCELLFYLIITRQC